MSIAKLTSASFTGKGVTGLPDTPGLSAAQMQAKFDEISKDVIAPKVNEIIDGLEGHTARVDNPHAVTKAQLGLGAVDNTADTEKPVSVAQSLYIDAAMTEVDTHLGMHTADRDNPHDVTAAQIGAAASADLTAETAARVAHEANVSNPHGVTLAQIGAAASADLTAETAARVAHEANVSNPHGVTAAQLGLVNHNYLVNWDFTNPVNQRGESTYALADAVGIDRWIQEPDSETAGTLLVRTGYVVWGGAYLAQKLPYLPAGTYTFSFDCSSRDSQYVTPEVTVNGTKQSGTAVRLNSTRRVVSWSFTLESDCAAGSVVVDLYNTNARYGLQLYRAKVERGTVSTLSGDAPADFAEQMMQCRQVFQNLTGTVTVSGATVGTNAVELYLPFCPPMRTVPSVTFETDSGSATATATASVYGVKLSSTGAFTVHSVCADAEA